MADSIEQRPAMAARPVVADDGAHPSAWSGLHRFLAGFPTAFFTLALIMDYTYSQSGTLQWQYFSTWLIVAALVTGGLAVLAGLIDWATGGARGRRGFGWHFGLTIVALLLGLVNAFVHSRDGWVAVVPEGLLLSLATVVVLYAGGFIGGLIDRPRRVAPTIVEEVRA